MLLQRCGIFGAAALFTVIVFAFALLTRRGQNARIDVFREEATSLGLRANTTDPTRVDPNYQGKLSGRDVIVGRHAASGSARTNVVRRPFIWIAMRVDVLDNAPLGANLHVAGQKRSFQAFRTVDADGQRVLAQLITDDVLHAASGLKELVLYSNGYHPGEGLKVITQEAWGASWTGAVMTTHIAPDANADAIRATAAQLARVADALEANRSRGTDP